MKDFILKPRVSEKAYKQSQVESARTYVFDVPLSANKHTVARAVSVQYEVTVKDVRISLAKGKVKQSYRKGSRPIAGVRSDIKKAYVTLKKGDAMPIFAEVEAEEKAEAEAVEKAAKKAVKDDAPKKRGILGKKEKK